MRYRSIVQSFCVFLVIASGERANAAFTPFTAGTDPRSVAVGDLNGDGRDDMVVGNWISGNVSVFINTAAPGATTPTFAAKVDFTTGAGPLAVTIVDLNGDGKPDLAVANSGAATVSVFRNTTALGSTTPSFAARQDFTTGAGNNPVAITAGDVNLDGIADIVVSCTGSPNNAEVLLNNTARGAATFTFATHQDFQANSANGIAIADLNGDGEPDLVVSGPGSAFVTVLRNTTAPGAATASFDPLQNFVTSDGPWGVAIGDMNGDGKLDIVVACVGSGIGSAVSILLNNTAAGATTFNFGVHQDIGALFKVQSVVLGDFNGDGKLDMATAGSGYPAVSVYGNISATGATVLNFARSDSTVGDSPMMVAAGNFNGDGKPDLVVAVSSATIGGIPGANDVEVSLTTSGVAGSPFYTKRQDFAAPVLPSEIATGDFNGDGKQDFASVAFTNQASVRLNTTTPGSTAASFSARQDFATGSQPGVMRVADLNGDGRPDLLAVNAFSNNISVLRNTTAPGATVAAFAAKQDLVTSNDPAGAFDTTDAVIVDVNADGKPDIVVSNNLLIEISVLVNQTAPGATSFSFASRLGFNTPAQPGAIAAADMNGDGKPDIVLANTSANIVSVLLNQTTPGGTPSFGFGASFTAPSPTSVSIGDVNGDGKPDIVAASQTTNTIVVLLNTTAPGADPPTFATHQDFAAAAGPKGHLVIADFNLDGKPDVAIANLTANTVSLFLNSTTTGATTVTFAPRVDLTSDTHPQSIAAADFTGDGWPDIANTNDAGVTVFMRTVPRDAFIISGNSQTVPLTTAFAPLTAIVKDASAIPVQYAPLAYQAVAGGNGASGTFAGPATVASNGDGIATAPTLTANTIAGSFTVTATASATSGAVVGTFNLTNAVAAPTNLVATASASLPVSVTITWTASPFATAYDVLRYTSFPVPGFNTVVASNLNATTFTDSSAAQNTAYIYAVRSANPSPGLFAYDLATTVIFTDPTITTAFTKVKAAHFGELQTAVHAVEALLSGSQTVFTDAPFTQNVTIISANHLAQLRTALNNARTALTVLPPIVYTHPTPVQGSVIYADDIRDLRNGVK